MKNNEQNEKNKKSDGMKVEWIGIDGLLMLLYAVLAIIYAYGIINRIDFIVGIMAPATAIIITCAVFFRYCFEVFSFTSKSGKRED